MKTRIGIAFVDPASGAIGEFPQSEEWFSREKKAVLSGLSKMFPEIEFIPYDIKNLADAGEFLKRGEGAAGYLVFVLNCIGGLLRPIVQSGKPTIMIGETYGGAGEFLLEYSRARAAGKPVLGILCRDIASEKVLKKVKLLDTIRKLRDSKILFVVSPGLKKAIDTEYPLSTDLWSAIRSVQTITGITPIILDVREFVESYYNKIDEARAREVADEWIKGASEYIEEEIEEILNSAKLYLAMKWCAKDYGADAIALDCIVLYRTKFLDAWPCLGYMEFCKNGEVVPVCEADPYSAVVLLIMKYLTGLPGFICDPSPDDLTGEVVYYHCYAPINPLGGSGGRVPYSIVPAHLGGKRASVYTELPTGEIVTVVGFDPEERTLTLHTARTIKNERSPQSCATKLVGTTNTKALAKNWRWRSGWHRVVFYGDWREDLKDFATLLGLQVLEEDRDQSNVG
jgi:hypothetical protein